MQGKHQTLQSRVEECEDHNSSLQEQLTEKTKALKKAESKITRLEKKIQEVEEQEESSAPDYSPKKGRKRQGAPLASSRCSKCAILEERLMLTEASSKEKEADLQRQAQERGQLREELWNLRRTHSDGVEKLQKQQVEMATLNGQLMVYNSMRTNVQSWKG